MALPSLNDTPKYELTVPSLKKKVKFRPYLVKEEKILLMASESKDLSQIMNAVLDTVMACLDGNAIKRNELTTFDIEYMFLQIRSKSVGEVVTLNIACEECDHDNEQLVDIGEIQCKVGKKSNIIKLSDDISIEMIYPSYAMVDFTEDEAQAGFSVLGKCMKTLITQEERIVMADESKESIDGFIDSMTQQQFEKVSTYLKDMPSVKHEVKFDCEKCGTHNNVVLEGMQSFF